MSCLSTNVRSKRKNPHSVALFWTACHVGDGKMAKQCIQDGLKNESIDEIIRKLRCGSTQAMVLWFQNMHGHCRGDPISGGLLAAVHGGHADLLSELLRNDEVRAHLQWWRERNWGSAPFLREVVGFATKQGCTEEYLESIYAILADAGYKLRMGREGSRPLGNESSTMSSAGALSENDPAPPQPRRLSLQLSAVSQDSLLSDERNCDDSPTMRLINSDF